MAVAGLGQVRSSPSYCAREDIRIDLALRGTRTRLPDATEFACV